jgi:ATP-dependent RNA helicase MSS116, mitochondrial
VIVFFPVARMVQFYAALFERLGFPALETHSRKSQAHRNRVSDTFRNEEGLVSHFY